MDRISVYATNCTGIVILLILYYVSRTKTARRRTEDPEGLRGYMAEAERLLEECGREHPYRLALSYGMSFYRGGTADDLMKDMDDKMYGMKTAHHAARR